MARPQIESSTLTTKSSEGSTTDKYLVTAIIVTHDGATWLPQVIAALSAQSRRVDRMIAVDTGSLDSSPKLLRAAGIPTIIAERDLGYGDAIEMALEHAPLLPTSVNQQEWIWLIHDDCAPSRDALELMLQELVERPQVIIAGPKLLGWYDRDHLLEAGISIANNGARWTGLEPGEQNQGQEDYTRDVMAVSTAGALINRAAFEELGGLDPNLALFRDDVDFGWRAHVAGYGAICVGQATVFHAQASASERRQVDVSEAFLHRPLLLDRRNAAYVLLVNASWWMLPWLCLQLVGTSLLRVIFDLVAKLPGYAGDEIAAIVLLLIHPRELLLARRARKRKRLLSSSVIKRFIPPRGSQIRAGWSQVNSAMERALASTGYVRNSDSQSDLIFAQIGTLDEDFDVPDFSPTTRQSLLSVFFKRRDVLVFVGVALLSLLAGRNRFGSLSGGALASIPHSSFDLLRSYLSSWHMVGMGSATPAPVWQLVLSIASLITLANLPLFISLLFFIAPPLSFYIFTKILKRSGISSNFAIMGGAIYALNPMLWSAINQGRIDFVGLYLLLPALLALNLFVGTLAEWSWRRTFAVALWVALLGALSPLLFALWMLVQIFYITRELFRSRGAFKGVPLFSALEKSELIPVWKRLILIASTFLMLMPWSLMALVHPTQWLVAPGIPLESGGAVKLLTFNLGGAGAPSLYMISPLVITLLAVLCLKNMGTVSIKVAALTSGAIVLNAFHVEGHGATAQIWSQDLLIVAAIIGLEAFLKEAERLFSNLKASRVGRVHFGVVATSLALGLSLVASIVWISSSQSGSIVRGNQPGVAPAFVNALASTTSRPKTMILSISSGKTFYFISRGNELSLGDADVTSSIPTPIQDAMTQLLTGGGISSSKVLGEFGIQYLFIKAPVSPALASLIDGIGGFARISATSSGTVWRIVGANPRVLFTEATVGKAAPVKIAIASSELGAAGPVTTVGKVDIAEKYDTNWRLLLGGQRQELHRSALGEPEFNISAPGQVLLSYDGTVHRAFLSLEFLMLIFSVIMALPYGRRRGEVPLEELA